MLIFGKVLGFPFKVARAHRAEGDSFVLVPTARTVLCGYVLCGNVRQRGQSLAEFEGAVTPDGSMDVRRRDYGLALEKTIST